eukprot:CAMPEP_0197709444 /NCGR_PEP_ID=MMETSP1338-20131121/128459_1 /TAXON_ID=43686 ORGANISM="Pelagodinium beii, Strain RCC1491" /NCGR_SAMPLE_ID=MMETSP1338 /ASSEMBLY_ACC=CAM_ASM_000754 /LENGTH=52 /DNA_ID=CAMNT_0043293379 /DNA_START=476 /DNA_END=634 /DNA_ORIENTATION=-
MQQVCTCLNKYCQDILAACEEDRSLANLVGYIDVGLVQQEELDQFRVVLMGS